MIYIGLAGASRVGKDTIADYLAERYGFIKCAFSDQLYAQVQEAFGLPDQELLRGVDTKDVPCDQLMLKNCKDEVFVATAIQQMDDENYKAKVGFYLLPVAVPLSPRKVLQWWGTEYRRAEDPDYWVKANYAWINHVRQSVAYPEQTPQLFVNTRVQYENEQVLMHEPCWNGNVWHVRRDTAPPPSAHSSDAPLPVLPGERELWNNDTIEKLHMGIDLLLSTNAQFVRVEPIVPDVEPAAEELHHD